MTRKLFVILLALFGDRLSFSQDISLSADFLNGQILLSWPSNEGEFFLEENESVADPAGWRYLNTPIAANGATMQAAAGFSGGGRFFRLRKWDILFDGTSLAAFRGYRQGDLPPTSQWRITVFGELEALNNAGPVHLITRDSFANFHLAFDWKTTPAGNSGVIYYGTETYETIASAGPEFQLLDNGGYPGLLANQKMGAAYRLFAPVNPVIASFGHWNSCEVYVEGQHVQHWLNGFKIVDYEINSPAFNANLDAAGPNYDVPGFGQGDANGAGPLIFLNQSGPTYFRRIRIRSLE